MVFRSGGKDDAKHSGATGKFLGKSGRPPGTSNQTNSISLQQGNFTDESDGATVSALETTPRSTFTPTPSLSDLFSDSPRASRRPMKNMSLMVFSRDVSSTFSSRTSFDPQFHSAVPHTRHFCRSLLSD